MMRPCSCSYIIILWGVLCLISVYGEGRHNDDVGVGVGVGAGEVVKRNVRKEIVTTEYGSISSVDGIGWESGRKKYQLQFISLDPNSLFLPAILHAHLVFYVHTGSARLSYSSLGGGGEMKEVKLRRGDVYSLESGTLFFIHNDLDESHRQRFRINAIFSNADHDQDKWIGPYSFIHHLFRGFHKTLLQAAFQVSEEVIEEITNGSCRTPPIVHAAAASKDETKIVDGIKRFGMDLHSYESKYKYDELNKKKKKKSTKTFNFFKEDPDVKNCNGWSTAVTSKDLPALKPSNIGVFMVNLTTNAMMAPHWNPTATEIGVVLKGRGMVRVVCSSNLTRPITCNNARFLVEEGDIFVIPRFHPMAHMSFNNETLVFMGFTTSHTNNHPQFLAGEASVLRALNQRMLQLAFNLNSTTISKLLGARKSSTILDCVSCAEEEQEIDKREEKVRKEEEERKRQEEEKQRRREKEEEEQRRQEEEKRQEEEERKQREEEEERRQQEKEEEKRREKEERRHQEEKEKRRWREEEEEDERRREEEEEEEKRRRQEEKEKQRRRKEEEEDERRRQEEEEQRRHRDEKERRRRREEEEERREQKEEEEKRRQEEEEIRREEEEEEERERGKEEQRRHREQEEKRRQREETEEEVARREEEERGIS